MYLFAANELIEEESEPEGGDEYIEVLKIKIEDLINMVIRGGK